MSEPLQLHIGGRQAHPDWKILDIEPRPGVDFVADASRLTEFADESVGAIYTSHVLEHFHYALHNEVYNTLQEWYRVLVPGGKLYVSVPDLRTLCWLYLHPKLSPQDRLHVMAMMFGGQINEYDVHKTGFDADLLFSLVSQVGFRECVQVPEFNLFDDCSSLRAMDTYISLNVIATK